MIKEIIKKNKRQFDVLILACCGLFICIVAVCFYGWLTTILFGEIYIEDIEDLVLYNMLDFFKNLMLIGEGILVVRFQERFRLYRGRAVFLIIPLLVNLLMYRIRIIVLCSVIISALMGICVGLKKIKVYLIIYAIVVILAIQYTMFIIIGCWIGIYYTSKLFEIAFIFQPFVVLFPIISLIKGVLYISDSSNQTKFNYISKGQNNVECLFEGSGSVQMCCPACGKEQETGNRFCFQCGQNLSTEQSEERYCSHCGAKVKNGMLFCIECGIKLS